MFLSAFLLSTMVALASAQNPSDAEILQATGDIWTAASSNFFSDSELQYDSDASETGKLFISVDPAKLASGTYAAYRALLNNYVDTTGTADSCDGTCLAERDDFLTQVMSSPAMAKALEYIEAWDGETVDLRTFIDDIWFQGYSRSDGSTLDSSGFEHVFLGEIDDNECKGYHNWITTYEDEQSTDFVYSSYQDFCEPDMPKFSMEYKGYFKSINSLMMKTSPEYELAVYTLLFRYRKDQVSTIDCGGVNVDVQIYRQHCDFNPNNDCVGSAFFLC